MRALQHLLGGLGARSGRNPHLHEISRFHDIALSPAFPAETRYAPSSLRADRQIGTSRNCRMTSAFVIVCDVGVNVRNVPAAGHRHRDQELVGEVDAHRHARREIGLGLVAARPTPPARR